MMKLSVILLGISFFGFFISCGINAYSMNNKLDIGFPPTYLFIIFLFTTVAGALIRSYYVKNVNKNYRKTFVRAVLNDIPSPLVYRRKEHIDKHFFSSSLLFEMGPFRISGSNLITIQPNISTSDLVTSTGSGMKIKGFENIEFKGSANSEKRKIFEGCFTHIKLEKRVLENLFMMSRYGQRKNVPKVIAKFYKPIQTRQLYYSSKLQLKQIYSSNSEKSFAYANNKGIDHYSSLFRAIDELAELHKLNLDLSIKKHDLYVALSDFDNGMTVDNLDNFNEELQKQKIKDYITIITKLSLIKPQ